MAVSPYNCASNPPKEVGRIVANLRKQRDVRLNGVIEKRDFFKLLKQTDRTLDTQGYQQILTFVRDTGVLIAHASLKKGQFYFDADQAEEVVLCCKQGTYPRIPDSSQRVCQIKQMFDKAEGAAHLPGNPSGAQEILSTTNEAAEPMEQPNLYIIHEVACTPNAAQQILRIARGEITSGIQRLNKNGLPYSLMTHLRDSIGFFEMKKMESGNPFEWLVVPEKAALTRFVYEATCKKANNKHRSFETTDLPKVDQWSEDLQVISALIDQQNVSIEEESNTMTEDECIEAARQEFAQAERELNERRKLFEAVKHDMLEAEANRDLLKEHLENLRAHKRTRIEQELAQVQHEFEDIARREQELKEQLAALS